MSKMHNTDMSRNRNFYGRDRKQEQEENRLLESKALARRCSIYVDTRSLMFGNNMAGVRALTKMLSTFGKSLLIPACMRTELQEMSDNGRDKAAVRALLRLERMERRGEAKVCNPESAALHADVAMLRILSDLEAGETAVFVTDDRVLAAKLAALDSRAATRRRGHILVRRLSSGGYLLPLPGIRNTSAAALGFTPWVKAPMPAICPHAYKPGDWDGEWDVD